MQSMTGFGRSEMAGPIASYRCEIKSVNSRFIEINVRLPRQYQEIESELTALIKDQLQRGKVDCFFEVQLNDRSQLMPEIDIDVLDQYIQHVAVASEKIARAVPGIQPQVNLSDLMRLDGVLASKSAASSRNIDHHRKGILDCLTQAIGQLRASRQREGQSLGVALTSLLEELRKDRQLIIDQLDDLREKIRSNYLKRLQTTIQQLQSSTALQVPTEERIAGEIAILLDKMDIEEELTRLRTHEEEFARVMSSEAAGRKLDFLCQEMHREVNTISNKAVQTECSRITVNMKQTIERIRQQVQNIE